jgi:hypothetical protein
MLVAAFECRVFQSFCLTYLSVVDNGFPFGSLCFASVHRDAEVICCPFAVRSHSDACFAICTKKYDVQKNAMVVLVNYESVSSRL